MFFRTFLSESTLNDIKIRAGCFETKYFAYNNILQEIHVQKNIKVKENRIRIQSYF